LWNSWKRTSDDGFEVKAFPFYRVCVSEGNRSIAFTSSDTCEVWESTRTLGFIQIPLEVFGRHGDQWDLGRPRRESKPWQEDGIATERTKKKDYQETAGREIKEDWVGWRKSANGRGSRDVRYWEI
jgi:hypothetical protein